MEPQRGNGKKEDFFTLANNSNESTYQHDRSTSNSHVISPELTNANVSSTCAHDTRDHGDISILPRGRQSSDSFSPSMILSNAPLHRAFSQGSVVAQPCASTGRSVRLPNSYDWASIHILGQCSTTFRAVRAALQQIGVYCKEDKKLWTIVGVRESDVDALEFQAYLTTVDLRTSHYKLRLRPFSSDNGFLFRSLYQDLLETLQKNPEISVSPTSYIHDDMRANGGVGSTECPGNTGKMAIHEALTAPYPGMDLSKLAEQLELTESDNATANQSPQQRSLIPPDCTYKFGYEEHTEGSAQGIPIRYEDEAWEALKTMLADATPAQRGEALRVLLHASQNHDFHEAIKRHDLVKALDAALSGEPTPGTNAQAVNQGTELRAIHSSSMALPTASRTQSALVHSEEKSHEHAKSVRRVASAPIAPDNESMEDWIDVQAVDIQNSEYTGDEENNDSVGCASAIRKLKEYMPQISGVHSLFPVFKDRTWQSSHQETVHKALAAVQAFTDSARRKSRRYLSHAHRYMVAKFVENLVKSETGKQAVSGSDIVRKLQRQNAVDEMDRGQLSPTATSPSHSSAPSHTPTGGNGTFATSDEPELTVPQRRSYRSAKMLRRLYQERIQTSLQQLRVHMLPSVPSTKPILQPAHSNTPQYDASPSDASPALIGC